MTDELNEQFQQASDAAKSLPTRPGNDDMLELYALYKQGSSGDVTGSRPGILDFVGGAKFDAWSKLEGVTQEAAMRRYIEKVQDLQAKG